MASTSEMIRIGFAADLGDGPVLASFVTFPPTAIDPLPVTGAAVPEIPEPGSLAVLGSVLGIVLMALRAHGRGRPELPYEHSRPAAKVKDRTRSVYRAGCDARQPRA